MTEKFKRIEKRYVLSDSSVNVYGYRLLTTGYEADQFRRNPIGYYMHRRDDGIALKWEDIQVDGDCISGIPVINLAHPRGEQICAEAANGFLNAASVGHIVVLEHSADPELQLPGQTGPTITRWYNKECSLVDIPGNCNALTSLYDAQENELNLISNGSDILTLTSTRDTLAGMCTLLQLPANSALADMAGAIKAITTKAEILATENSGLAVQATALQQQIAELKATQTKSEINSVLDRALEERKITVELRSQLAADYAGNPDGLRRLVAALPVYRSVTGSLIGRAEAATTTWQWDDYEKNDPSGKLLKELRSTDPVRYKQIFDNKFASV